MHFCPFLARLKILTLALFRSAYIEGELKRIKGETTNEDNKIIHKSREDALYEMPEHLQRV